MEPLIVQMYAGPDVAIVDLGSVDLGTLSTLVSSNSRLIFLNETDRFADVDIERYGEPVQYTLSLPSRILKRHEIYQVLSIEPSSARH